MANYMSEVAKMLGVELGEEFEMINELGEKFMGKYYFTYTGVEMDNSTAHLTTDTLYNLICGNYSIKRNPWKPRDEEAYWYVDEHGNIWTMNWENEYLSNHVNYYKLGNCYRTKEEALANRDKWVAFYASDEVLEV